MQEEKVHSLQLHPGQAVTQARLQAGPDLTRRWIGQAALGGGDGEVLHDPILGKDRSKEVPVPGEIVLPRYTETFPRRLNVVAGDAQFVAGAVEEILSGLPEAFALAQNYPNPFNPNTTLRYALPHPARGSLKVYNLLGQEIISLVQGWMDMGRHEIVWDGRDGAGRNIASGIYSAVFSADGKIITRKMVLLK